MDICVRIPRFSVESLNFESVANLLAANNVSYLIKLDTMSLLRHIIRFSCACVRVDITAPLLKYVEIKRVGGVEYGYVSDMKTFHLDIFVDVMIKLLIIVLSFTLLRQ